MSAEVLAALRGVLESDVGRQTLLRLAEGQGVDTEDGRAWLGAKKLLDALEGRAAPVEPEIQKESTE